MKLPRLMVPFLCGKVHSTRCTVGSGKGRWIVYASRGIRYVVFRATHRERPWVCYRFNGSTDSWDRGTYAEKEDFVMSFLRRLQRPSEAAVDRAVAHDPQLAGKYPALHEYLTAVVGPDGKRRQTSSLTVYSQQGRFRGFLNDRDSGGSLGAESDSFTGLLGALEAELESDSPNWFWREGGSKHPAKNRKGGA